MGIIDGEPNGFILLILNVLERLGLIKPSTHEMTPEEKRKFREMMEAKSFHFKEESNGVGG